MYRERYVSVEDLLDWLDDRFKPGENGVTDFVVSVIQDRLTSMPYMTGGRIETPELPFYEAETPEQPDPFDRADFLHDDMLEEEWND